MRLSPLELLEKLAAFVPLPHVHLVRYGGCLAPHSHLRGAIIPTPRQQGLDGAEADTGVAVLELGAAPAAGVCAGDGHMSVLSARGAATHRRHHAGRGDPQDPPPSETCCRPTPHRACPYPPNTVRLGGLSRRQRVGARWPCARRDGVAHTAERVPSCVAIDLPTLLSPKAPLRRSPPPAGAAAPAPGALARCGRGSTKRPFIFLIRWTIYSAGGASTSTRGRVSALLGAAGHSRCPPARSSARVTPPLMGSRRAIHPC